MSSILDDARGHRDRIISVRREINENPEPGFAEEKTASLVERLLDEFGVEHTRTAGTGVVGTLNKQQHCHKQYFVQQLLNQ